MINKIMWRIREKGGKFGINYFSLSFTPISRKLEENYFLLFYPNLSQIGINYFSLTFLPIFANWNIISPNNCHLLAILFIYIIVFALIWLFWGKNVPTLIHKIFIIKYFTAE